MHNTSSTNLTLTDDLDSYALPTVTSNDLENKLAAWRERYTKLLRELAKTPQTSADSPFNASVYGGLAPLPHSLANFTVDLTAQVRRRDDPGRTVIMILAYTIIICVSLFGNLLVCHVVIRNRRLHTLTNTFLANLAVSDLLMTALNIPFNVARVLLDDWPFGGFMCSVVPFVQATSVYVSAFTMVAIALDRYQVIVHPLKPRLGAFHGAVILIVVWLLAALVSLPYAIYSEVVEVVTYRKLTRCQARYPHPALEFRQWLTLATFLTQYALPLSITAVAYVGVTRRVWSRGVVGAATKEQLSVQLRAKKKTVKMLLVVVVLFALCWLPLNTYHLVVDFGGALGPFRHSSSIFFLCHWFAMSNVCYNPFIYCWLNDHFRSGAKSLLWCVARRVCRVPLSESDEELPGVRTHRPTNSVTLSSSALTGGSVRRKVPGSVRCLPHPPADVHVTLDSLVNSPATQSAASGIFRRNANRRNLSRASEASGNVAREETSAIMGPVVTCSHGSHSEDTSMPRVEVDPPRHFLFKCPNFRRPFSKGRTIETVDGLANEHGAVTGRKRKLQKNGAARERGTPGTQVDDVDVVYVEFERLAQNPTLRPIPEESPRTTSPQSPGRHFRSLSDTGRSSRSPPAVFSNDRSLFLRSTSNTSEASVQTIHVDEHDACENASMAVNREGYKPSASPVASGGRCTKDKPKTTSLTRNILRNIRDSIAASLARSLPFLRSSQTSSSIQTTATSNDGSDNPSFPNTCWSEEESAPTRPFRRPVNSSDFTHVREQEFSLPNAPLTSDPAMVIRRPILDSGDLLSIDTIEDNETVEAQKPRADLKWTVNPKPLHRAEAYRSWESGVVHPGAREANSRRLGVGSRGLLPDGTRPGTGAVLHRPPEHPVPRDLYLPDLSSSSSASSTPRITPDESSSPVTEHEAIRQI